MDFAHFGAYKVILEMLSLNRPFRIFCSKTILELFWNHCSGTSYILQKFKKQLSNLKSCILSSVTHSRTVPD